MISLFDVPSHPALNEYKLGCEGIAGSDEPVTALSPIGCMTLYTIGPEAVEERGHKGSAEACAGHASLTPVAGFKRNLLLDLSPTLCKYTRSALNAVLRSLFGRSDKRVWDATDPREWTHSTTEDRFEYSFQRLSTKGKETIIASDDAMVILNVTG